MQKELKCIKRSDLPKNRMKSESVCVTPLKIYWNDNQICDSANTLKRQHNATNIFIFKSSSNGNVPCWKRRRKTEGCQDNRTWWREYKEKQKKRDNKTERGKSVCVRIYVGSWRLLVLYSICEGVKSILTYYQQNFNLFLEIQIRLFKDSDASSWWNLDFGCERNE